MEWGAVFLGHPKPLSLPKYVSRFSLIPSTFYVSQVKIKFRLKFFNIG